MPNKSILEALQLGAGARLALGSTVLVYLIVYNEVSATCTVFSILLSSLYGSIAAHCKSSLHTLQMPYIRASNRFDFACLFFASWYDILAVLCACGILARTLSTCLDALTGGAAYLFILGRNSPGNEPWPDALGVAVVFLVTGMFCLGLEHTKAFSLIMTLGSIGVSVVMSSVSWSNGNFQGWSDNYFLPDGLNSFLKAAALLVFTFPSDFPTQRSGWHRFSSLLLISLAIFSLLVAAVCLSTITQYKFVENFVAMPIFFTLDESNFHKLIPAAACFLMLTCSAAFLELFPELYGLIVRFAKSDWKILSRQIAYESAESGNPVLAVFIAGSFCAMIAFACPLQHLIYTLAGSHLCAGIFRSFYLLYVPYRPKYTHQNNISLSYSRLAVAPNVKPKSSASSAPRRSLWNLSLSKQPKLGMPKKKNELEKEWLLLGEPTSPCPKRELKDVESSIMSDALSDVECVDEKSDNSDSDSSTDIDALVDEYRQKVKVTTAGPMEHTMQIPTPFSWHITIFAISIAVFGIGLILAGVTLHWVSVFIVGSVGVLIVSSMMIFIPKYTGCVINVSPILCCVSISLAVVLFSTCAIYSWLATLIWFIAGTLLLHYDNLCCTPLTFSRRRSEQLIQSVSMPTLHSNS